VEGCARARAGYYEVLRVQLLKQLYRGNQAVQLALANYEEVAVVVIQQAAICR
jgi:hypothetical protein